MIIRKEGEALEISDKELEKFEKLGWEKADEKEVVAREFVINDEVPAKKK
jgi:hypothetical protein